MAKKDVVRRTQEAGWRSAGNKTPVKVQRAWYDQDMKAVGRNKPSTFNKKTSQDEIQGWGDFLSHPVSIVVLTLLTFALVFGVLLWREGRLKGLLSKDIVAESKSWMHGGTAGGAQSGISSLGDVDPTEDVPNEMEAMLNPNPVSNPNPVDIAAERAAAIAATAGDEQEPMAMAVEE
jgi:hypothetical protein